ncbi:kinase-like domain-containing protein [Boletus edulis]|nr:kinase-like domain-containing protein [Boletus edulis]
MARRELGIWRRLDHPNIVPFLGIATGFGVSGSTSLVSSWMCNGTLASFLQKYENLEVGHRLRLVMHSFTLPIGSPDSTNPIIHGDLNPANVLLDDDFTARLVDFGYPSMVAGLPEALIYLRRSTCRPGALRWNAPEQISSEKVSSNSKSVRWTTETDVLSGKQPWSEIGEEVVVILRLLKGEIPGRPESRPIDDQHWELIKRCLSRIPDRRPAANTIVSILEQFLEHFPHSQPLRDVIKSLQETQQSDSSDSSSIAVPGGTAMDGVIWSDRPASE